MLSTFSITRVNSKLGNGSIKLFLFHIYMYIVAETFEEEKFCKKQTFVTVEDNILRLKRLLRKVSELSNNTILF